VGPSSNSSDSTLKPDELRRRVEELGDVVKRLKAFFPRASTLWLVGGLLAFDFVAALVGADVFARTSGPSETVSTVNVIVALLGIISFATATRFRSSTLAQTQVALARLQFLVEELEERQYAGTSDAVESDLVERMRDYASEIVLTLKRGEQGNDAATAENVSNRLGRILRNR
jgi:hypothetical protein